MDKNGVLKDYRVMHTPTVSEMENINERERERDMVGCIQW